MRAEILITSVIALSGLLAVGQAVNAGLEGSPPPEKPFDPATIRCASPYEVAVSGERDMTVAVVGDGTAFRRPPADPATSWLTYLPGNGVRVGQSWIDPSADLTELAGEVSRTQADVLVILAGSNDVREETPKDQIELALQRIVDRTGAPRVLLSTIPPVPHLAQETADYNDLLSRIAYRHDWSFVNAGATVVTDNCTYARALGGPGPRPTVEGAQLIGRAIQGILTTRASLVPDE